MVFVKEGLKINNNILYNINITRKCIFVINIYTGAVVAYFTILAITTINKLVELMVIIF